MNPLAPAPSPVGTQDDPHTFALMLRDHLRNEASTYDAWRNRHYASVAERITHHAELLSVLYAGGWNRYGWPTPVGRGGDPRHRAALYDELAAAGLPVPEPCLLLETLGSPLVHFAPDLAAELLPAFLSGAEWWGQCFSEPEAGSDLAALRCRARRDGDHLVISGQKLWTSHGATAKRFVVLVRTGTTESRHRGLTMVIVDADARGLSRRPIALASGAEELAEIFFDEVRVPVSRIIGAENVGWSVAMYLLQFERAMYAWQSAASAVRRLGDLRSLAAGHPVGDGMTARFGEVYSDLITLRARSAQTLERLARGESVGPEASVDKILLARLETGLYDLARDLLGERFLLSSDPAIAEWRSEWWYSRSATILGGSAEVQRTILADHVLKLPKETS